MIDKKTELMNRVFETLVPTKTLNDELKLHVKAVKEFVSRGRKDKNPIKSFLPRLVVSFMDIENPGQRSMAVLELTEFPETNNKKRQLMAQLGIACAANDLKVVYVVFESEAWMAQEKRDPGDKTLEPKDYTPPSKRPDRQEIIMVVARSMDGREALAGIPITGRHSDDGSLILGTENVYEFTEDGVIKDSLLSEFFSAHSMAWVSKIEADHLVSKGEEVPELIQQMVLLMDSCPIKIK